MPLPILRMPKVVVTLAELEAEITQPSSQSCH